MDVKSVLNTLKEASLFDIFLVSFFLLPFVFQAWLDIADALKWDVVAKCWTLVVVLLLYAAGVIAMLCGMSRARRREIARDQIVQYLTAKGYEMMSFERVRLNISNTYANEFLAGLAISFPNTLRRAKLKGGKDGLARIMESNVEAEA